MINILNHMPYIDNPDIKQKFTDYTLEIWDKLFNLMKPNNYKSIRFSRLKGWSGLISMFFYIINSRAVNDILTSPGSSGQSRCAVYIRYVRQLKR